MVEALDRMVTEGLTTELEQIAQERKAAVEDRAKAVAKLQEATGTFDTFLVKTLSEEIKELHSERAQQQEVIGKLEKFVKHTSKAVNEAVTDYLKGEMTQLKEDIQVAKENTFGRKIFETFATEFSASHLNENQKIKELEAAVAKAAEEVAQINESLEEKAKLVESKEQEIAMIQEGVERKETLNTLLKPLNKDKAAIMTDLLESVQTSKLKTAFDRYLPAVLDGKSMIKESKESKKETITEVTGNKEQKTVQVQDDSNIVDIRKLAGLK
jgi:DNA repair exonuclease SbcCD ATPase subunit